MGEKRPQTVEDLADEALGGFEKLLSPETLAAMKQLLGDLYATHPVMSRLADEALVDTRPAALASDEKLKPGVEAPPPAPKRKLDEG